MRCCVAGYRELLAIRFGGLMDAFRIRGWLKVEGFREFRRIEDVVGFVLIEHLVQFPNSLIKPTCGPDHRPGEDSVLRRLPKLVRDEFYELLARRRVGSSRNMPGLVPGTFAIS